jgi:protein-S-isoprenylcysteine O-methyltransferase Ste14
MELEDKNVSPHKNKVHHILAHSYFFFFLLFLFGIFLDLILPIKIFQNQNIKLVGFFFLCLATVLILWAQMTSRSINKENLTAETFYRGPYRLTRSPTHWGLFLLALGFGFVVNAGFIVLCTVISFFIAKLTFLKKEEAVLAERYGAPYLEYKRKVRF